VRGARRGGLGGGLQWVWSALRGLAERGCRCKVDADEGGMTNAGGGGMPPFM
jgi:hypothetical protein